MPLKNSPQDSLNNRGGGTICLHKL